MGTTLANFTDFVAYTSSAYVTSPTKFLNDAVSQNYSLSRFLKGKDMDVVIQGGQNIKDEIMFDESNTFTNYNPNAEFNYSQPQVSNTQTLNWRFSMDHMSWTEQEVILNSPSGMGRAAQFKQFKKLKKKLEQRVHTSILKGMESKVWADAGTSALYTAMESSTADAQGGEQMSIPAYISEDTTNYHANGWTNILGIDPAGESKWRNQVETYDYDDPDDSDGDADGLIDAFDNMLTDVQFIAPDYHKEHFEQSYQVQRQAIFCSKGGLNQYKRLLRASNDTLVRKQDASFNRPQFDGVDLVRVSELDTATIVWDGSSSTTAATELNATKDGYRYFWINGTYLTPVFHSEKYFDKGEPFALEKQPFTRVCVYDVWWNIFCNSRQRHGIVAPQ